MFGHLSCPTLPQKFTNGRLGALGFGARNYLCARAAPATRQQPAALAETRCHNGAARAVARSRREPRCGAGKRARCASSRPVTLVHPLPWSLRRAVAECAERCRRGPLDKVRERTCQLRGSQLCGKTGEAIHLLTPHPRYAAHICAVLDSRPTGAPLAGISGFQTRHCVQLSRVFHACSSRGCWGLVQYSESNDVLRQQPQQPAPRRRV